MRASLAAVLGGLLLGACGGGTPDNAICEVELVLPPAFERDGRAYEFVALHVRRGPVEDFETAWGNATPATPLAAASSTLVASVVSERDFDAALLMKVVFCESARCSDGPGAIARWYAFERVFYQGEVTTIRLLVADAPLEPSTSPTRVGRCLVAGCGARGMPLDARGFCDDDDLHPCD